MDWFFVPGARTRHGGCGCGTSIITKGLRTELQHFGRSMLRACKYQFSRSAAAPCAGLSRGCWCVRRVFRDQYERLEQRMSQFSLLGDEICLVTDWMHFMRCMCIPFCRSPNSASFCTVLSMGGRHCARAARNAKERRQTASGSPRTSPSR